jgi:hypothetical protein
MTVICPIMSRPKQGDVIAIDRFEDKVALWKSEDEMKEYGYFVADGIPFSNIFPCIETTCMAWSPTAYRCQLAWLSKCEDQDTAICNMDTCRKCVKVVHEEGYCKLIKKGASHVG